MSRNRVRLDTAQQKGIYERFRYLSDRYGRWEVWTDFITMSACSLCLSDRQMAKLTAGDLQAQLEQQTWLSVCAPAVGAGALLIAFAQECIGQEINYQTSALFVGQDVDRTAAMMGFVQLSLLGCPGYVVVGDSLLNPVVGPSVLLPVPQEGQEIWYTPMYFADTWQLRVAAEKIKLLSTRKEGEAS